MRQQKAELHDAAAEVADQNVTLVHGHDMK